MGKVNGAILELELRCSRKILRPSTVERANEGANVL